MWHWVASSWLIFQAERAKDELEHKTIKFFFGAEAADKKYRLALSRLSSKEAIKS